MKFRESKLTKPLVIRFQFSEGNLAVWCNSEKNFHSLVVVKLSVSSLSLQLLPHSTTFLGGEQEPVIKRILRKHLDGSIYLEMHSNLSFDALTMNTLHRVAQAVIAAKLNSNIFIKTERQYLQSLFCRSAAVTAIVEGEVQCCFRFKHSSKDKCISQHSPIIAQFRRITK